MQEKDFLFYAVIGLIFLSGILYAYACFLKQNNRELSDLLEQTFENEQRIADKLDIAHQALKDANEDMQKHNQEHLFNGRIRLINTALEASKPEYLKF